MEKSQLAKETEPKQAHNTVGVAGAPAQGGGATPLRRKAPCHHHLFLSSAPLQRPAHHRGLAATPFKAGVFFIQRQEMFSLWQAS